MRSTYDAWALTHPRDWGVLRKAIGCEANTFLAGILTTMRSADAKVCIAENTYIDRDFSSGYAAFYATVYKAYTKYCRRIHFFKSQDADLQDFENDIEALSRWVRSASEGYLGYVVIRPLRHAPVSHALISARDVSQEGTIVSVRSKFKIHLLGSELTVEGAPVTEQDTRTGACAQAAIWMAGRHIQNKHAAPWFSTSDITAAALRFAESDVMRSLPAGSDYLTGDAMVRALRAMGESPKVYGRDRKTNEWSERPARIVARYVDSGIPVIVGLNKKNGIGHAVVVVGTHEKDCFPSDDDGGELRTTSDRIDRFVVHDDQRGAYLTLPIKVRDRGRDSIPFSLDQDADFILIPLPGKVFMAAEVAETLAFDRLKTVSRDRRAYAAKVRGCEADEIPEVDPEFHAAVENGLVARTYLTHGWRYKHRALRNAMSNTVKAELLNLQLPRYVWVTEFSLPDDVVGFDPCRHKVRAHVIVDATGSRFWESEILTHVPGLLLIETFDVKAANQELETIVRIVEDETPYYPKIRGRDDYADCAIIVAEPVAASPDRVVDQAQGSPGE